MSNVKSVIDVHHHIIPPQLVAALSQHAKTGIIIPTWSVEKDLEDMDPDWYNRSAAFFTRIWRGEAGSYYEHLACRDS